MSENNETAPENENREEQSQEQAEQDNHENQQEGSQGKEAEAQEEPEEKFTFVPPPRPNKIFDRTSVLLVRSHDDKDAEGECSYCDGKRTVDNMESGETSVLETDLKYHKLGFTCTKLRTDDLEHFLDRGFTRCGTYIYQRSSRQSCCEVWQYRVPADKFKISHGQKKVIKRFHNYLNYGDIHGPKKDDENEQIEENSEMVDETSASQKDQIIETLKQSLQTLIFAEIRIAEAQIAIVNIEKVVFGEMEAKILSKHKITYNQKLGVLTSNILMIKSDDKVSVYEYLQQQKGLAQMIQGSEVVAKVTLVLKENVKFINYELNEEGQSLFKKEKVQKKKVQPKPKQNQANNVLPQCDPKYMKFQEYLQPHIPYVPVSEPKHLYTIELHRAVFTDELFDVYAKYEKAVHNKERDKEQLKRFVCSSPVYDPNNPIDNPIRDRMAPYNYECVDDLREYKDEPVYPGQGSFHYYHRIDGRLVAMGVVDITNKVLNSQYFIYDPEFAFLRLGVVGAIHEIEYMRMVQKNYNPYLNEYQLGELVLNCPKVNYKLSYQPGYLICPRTKALVPFNDEIKQKCIAYSKMPIKFKNESLKETLNLKTIPPGVILQDEMLAEMLKDDIVQLPFLYENTQMLAIDNLQEAGKKHVIPLVLLMIRHIGLDNLQKLILELKFQKKAPEPEKEEAKEESPKPDKEEPEQVSEHQNDKSEEKEKSPAEIEANEIKENDNINENE